MKKRMIGMVTGAILLGGILWGFPILTSAEDIENSMLEIQATPLQEEEEASEEIQEEGIETTLNVSDQLLRESEETEELQEEAADRESSSKNLLGIVLPVLGGLVLLGCVIGGAFMFRKKK